MGSFVIRCTGRLDGSIAGWERGALLLDYDAEALGGRGYAKWTRDPRLALRFTTPLVAHRACMAAPLVVLATQIEPVP